ncbi:MAG: M24 family metallopeptidase [Planctomycetota bacterium]
MNDSTNARARIARLEEATRRAGFDGVLVVPGPNLEYLTGLSFHLSERPTVAFFPMHGKPTIALPGFELSKTEGSGLGWDAFGYDDGTGPAPAFAKVRESLRLSGARWGVEGRRLRFLELRLLEGTQLENADATFAELRMRKGSDEIAAMRRAVEIAEAALAATLPLIRVGVAETTIAAELTLQTLRAGSDPHLPFMPIVAAGPNGARPHAVPGPRSIERGDLVTVDWGASHRNYFSDITRTFAVGAAPRTELKAAYEAVRAANAAGRAAVRPGATGQDVDRATRAVIVAAGLGEYFTHRTGHGLGLESHEEPDMKEGSLIPLEPGMTFTVEPGVYLPGLGGIRIEDDIVVTEAGGESLTGLPRELQILDRG